MEAAARPLPREDTTPPVTKMYFAAIDSSDLGIYFAEKRARNAGFLGVPRPPDFWRKQSGARRRARAIMTGNAPRSKNLLRRGAFSSWGGLTTQVQFQLAEEPASERRY